MGRLKFGSLFSGIGGIDLGLERAGWRCMWQVENDPQAQAVLKEHWPNVTRFDDIRSIDVGYCSPVDLICGGFPCQDISDAHTNGRRRGLDGEQSGLWREFGQTVYALRPRWVLVENVAAWRRWVSTVRADLSKLGYASVPLELSAGSFGAPHIRPRIFVVADAHSDGESLRALDAKVASLPFVPGEVWNGGPPTADALRMDDGIPKAMDRLRLCGNAVVPQVAEWIGRALWDASST